MESYYLNSEVLNKLSEAINASKLKEKYFEYIDETIKKCRTLFEAGEGKRVLIEVRFLIINLRKEFDI